MKEGWLMPDAFVPVDVETTAALITEIKKLIGVVGGMALNQQRTWVGLTDEEKADLFEGTAPYYNETDYADAIEAKLKEKNT